MVLSICMFQGDIDLCGGDPNDGIDSDCSASSNSGKQVLVGICAMAKKAQSKPMTEILTRLREFDYIHMIVFEEDVILKVKQKNDSETKLIQLYLNWIKYIFTMEYFNRILLRTGQSAIVWYRFIQKVFHSKKPFNMHSCANRTLSIIYTCNTIFRIDERFTQFLKVLALKFRDTQCWTGIHRTPSVCWPNDSLNTLSDNIYQMFYHFYLFSLF